MELYNATLAGDGAKIPTDPTDPRHAVPLEVMQAMVASGLFVSDVTPISGGDIVGLKGYVPNSVPADFYLTTATTNTESVRVHFTASPTNAAFGITVSSTDKNGAVVADVANISADPANPRVFQGYIDLELDGADIDQDITITSDAGGEYTFNMAVLIGGPTVDSVAIDSIPLGQSTVKSGDTITISGVVGNDALELYAQASGAVGSKTALTLGALDSAGIDKRTFTGSVSASSASGTQTVNVFGVNILGTEGDATASTGVSMDQTYPSIANGAYSYPAGQTAIKGNESVDIDIVITNHTEVDYVVATGLSINDPNAYASTKTVTRIDETIQYEVSSNKLAVTATRSTNGAVTTKNFQVDVAATAMVVTASVVGTPASLASSADGTEYTVRLDSNQEFLRAPDAFSATSADFIGGWSMVTAKRYQHAFNITDAMARGVQNFEGGIFTNRAGIQTTVITDPGYVIGGLVERDITFPAGAQFAPIGASVYDISKTVSFYSGADELVLQADTADVVRGYTIVDSNGDYDPNGDYLFISDAAFAGSNTSGTLVLTLSEGV